MDSHTFRFSVEVHHVADQAGNLAEEFNSNAVAPIHIFLGLLKVPDCDAALCLSSLGANLLQLEETARLHIKTSAKEVVQSTDKQYTEETKEVLKLAAAEALNRQTACIQTRHILAAIIQMPMLDINNWLREADITLTAVRKLPQQKQEAVRQMNQHNWDRFTQTARNVLSQAQAKAEMYKQAEITPDHVLLGLFELPDSEAMKRLLHCLKSVSSIQEQLIAHLQLSAGTEEVLNIVLSKPLKQVLELAVIEAKRTDLPYIDSSFLLLGIIGETESFAAQLLLQAGMTVNSIREQPFSGSKEWPEPVLHIPIINQQPVSISPIFILLLLLTVVSGLVTYYRLIVPNVTMLLFVVSGWLISLCLHEFGHAAAAYWGGDKSVVFKGYLNLNPTKYTHPMWSIFLPMLSLFAGGIGLPGGAVYVNTLAIRDRIKRSLTSFAGPIATVLFGALLIGLYSLYQQSNSWFGHYEFWAGASLLIYLQVTSCLLCLLPLPGLDGYFAIEPYLPDSIRSLAESLQQFVYILVVVLFSYDTPFRTGFLYLINLVANILHLNITAVYAGLNLFRFWQN